MSDIVQASSSPPPVVPALATVPDPSEAPAPQLSPQSNRERVAKGAAAAGVVAGTMLGLGMGLVGGVVIGVTAGGVMGLAAFGEGGKLNKVAQATGRGTLKAYDAAKSFDEKHHVGERISHISTTIQAKVKEYRVEERAKAKVGQLKGIAAKLSAKVKKPKESGGDGGGEDADNDEDENEDCAASPAKSVVRGMDGVDGGSDDSEDDVQPADVASETVSVSSFELQQALILFPPNNTTELSDITYDLTNPQVRANWLNEKVEIPEGTKMQERWIFFARAPLTNLTYTRNTYRSGIRVSKESIVLGTFPANNDHPYVFAFDEVTIPTGVFVRGTFVSETVVSCVENGRTNVLLKRNTTATIVKKQSTAVQ